MAHRRHVSYSEESEGDDMDESEKRSGTQDHRNHPPPSYDDIIRAHKAAASSHTSKIPTAPPLPSHTPPPNHSVVIPSSSTAHTAVQLESENRQVRGRPPPNRSKECKCDFNTLKKIGLAYAAIGVFVTLPVCITMAVFGQSDGPQNITTVANVSMTEAYTTTPASTTFNWNCPWCTPPSPTSTTVSFIVITKRRCSAQPNLPAYVTVSAIAGCCIFLALSIYYLVGEKTINECGCDESGIITLRIFSLLGLLIVIIFYCLGSMSTYQMWFKQECDPFSSEGCPYSFCDNRLMKFVYIFYPGTTILLYPFWVVCIYYAFMTMRSLAFS